MATPRRRQHGISLVEALVAMLVMSFGTVALLGVQAKLRLNSDIAKQRSEAVRLAQESLENLRGFATVADFEALASLDPAEVEDTDSNTTFSRTVTVIDGAAERERTVSVDVSWTDRTGQAQSITLMSAVHGVPPALAGSLAVASGTSFTATPGQRHPAIPRDAEIQIDGTSRFTLPGATNTTWDFNNTTGVIQRICVDGTCTDTNARLLSGYVRFATGASQPSGDDAELPPSAKPGTPLVEVEVAVTAPAASTVLCYEDQGSTSAVPYYCAIPLGLATSWSGQSRVVNLSLAGTIATSTATVFRVCRYTTLRSHATAPSGIANQDHPLNYASVSTALVQQNFLVIRAGDGTTAFDCPDDTDDDPLAGRTWHHQPST